MVYVDELMHTMPDGRVCCYMVAETVYELFEAAIGIGLNPKWVVDEAQPYFRLVESKRDLAIRAGAAVVEYEELLAVEMYFGTFSMDKHMADAVKEYDRRWQKNGVR